MSPFSFQWGGDLEVTCEPYSQCCDIIVLIQSNWEKYGVCGEMHFSLEFRLSKTFTFSFKKVFLSFGRKQAGREKSFQLLSNLTPTTSEMLIMLLHEIMGWSSPALQEKR